MNKIFCVISHTHWDREWYMPFERFRIKLVNLIDNVLEILKSYPEYIFHLDAQTVVLEDYLEIKPLNKSILSQFISEGRLIVGPWYIQNDFYLTSGESTIRNLQIGSDIAEDFGKCSLVGYAADQFGMMSQLPQIFNGFGIDSCIFGRGYHFYNTDGIERTPKTVPTEFLWKGKNGSEVLAVHMLYWYNNAQRFSEDISKSMKLLENIERNFEGVALTPYLLLMNGVDHLEAQENLLPILEQVNHNFPETLSIKQYTMQQYIKDVKEYLEDNREAVPLPVYEGELRNGVDSQILQGTLSTRSYLKVLNFKAQNLLEGILEPTYSFIHSMGAKNQYPSEYMTHLWKSLIKNHAHDSICGCSRDEVHEHMEDRYKVINEIGYDLRNRGLDFISSHVDREALNKEDYLITVMNTVEVNRNEVVELELHFPEDEKVQNFELLDPEGNKVPFEVLSKEKMNQGIFTAINLPGTIPMDSYRVQFYVNKLEGFSYRTYLVKTSGKVNDNGGIDDKATRESILENEYLKVLISTEGKIDLFDKVDGKWYEDILTLEDTEDCGDSYTYKRATHSKTITSKEFIPEISCIRHTEFEHSFMLKYNLLLPECFDKVAKMRSTKLINNTTTITLNLKKGSKRLEISFQCDNTSKDHRLRAFLATGIDCDYTNASIPFDIIERDKKEVLKGIQNGTQPNSGLIGIDGEYGGITLYTEGIYEYEHLMGETGVIAVTLVRANSWISIDTGTGIMNQYRDDTWMAPGNQCIRKIELHMAIQPHKLSLFESDSLKEVRTFQNPVLSYFQPVDLKKFSGGRPAVQDTDIKEIFYRKDSFPEILLPREMKFLDIQGKNILISSLKKAGKNDNLILRLYNAGKEESEASISLTNKNIKAYKTNMNEEIIEELDCEGSSIKPFFVSPGEIVTLALLDSSNIIDFV